VTVPVLEQLLDALLGVAPTLEGSDGLLAASVYRLLARGAPVDDATLAAATGLSPEHLRHRLDAWSGVGRNPQDEIVAFWGLCLHETAHALDLPDGQRVYAWCAWDTLFLPQLLQVTVQVHSIDPHNGHTLDLTVSPQGVMRRSHNDAVVSFVHPDEACREDIVANFCHQVFFFTDLDSATPWFDSHRGTFPVSLDDAFDLGQHWNRARALS
jgi:alkylmercury lyase